jgi:hypothetical protein
MVPLSLAFLMENLDMTLVLISSWFVLYSHGKNVLTHIGLIYGQESYWK